jgi:hypothetical protein
VSAGYEIVEEPEGDMKEIDHPSTFAAVSEPIVP